MHRLPTFAATFAAVLLGVVPHPFPALIMAHGGGP
jgi:hypothetical protein